MLFSQRRLLHKAIAEYYENHLLKMFSIIAHHWYYSLEKGVGRTMELNLTFQAPLDNNSADVIKKIIHYSKKVAKQVRATASSEAGEVLDKVEKFLLASPSTEA